MSSVVVVDVDARVGQRGPLGLRKVRMDEFHELRVERDVVEVPHRMLEHLADETLKPAADDEHPPDLLRLAHDEMSLGGEIRGVREGHRREPVEEDGVLVVAPAERDVLVAGIHGTGLDELRPRLEAFPPLLGREPLDPPAPEECPRQEGRCEPDRDHPVPRTRVRLSLPAR